MPPLIRNALVLALAALSSSSLADDSRYHGRQDTERRPGVSAARSEAHPGRATRRQERPPAVERGRARLGIAPVPPQHGYWSLKCVRQRGSPLSPWNHSRDCDNPAYTGGHSRPYPHFAPAPGGRPPIVIRRHGDRYR
jgi:hypothetical protein